jgi:citrate lyase beta subunit
VTALRHFEFLGDPEVDALFRIPPQPFARNAERQVLANALGATLYSPATRPDLASDLVMARAHGLVSSVVCLEDSIADDDVTGALDHVVDQIDRLHDELDAAPLVFVRVRAADQVRDIVDRLGSRTDAIAGFVLPKFGTDTGEKYLEEVQAASRRIGRRLWTMPIIESPEVAHREQRIESLLAIDELLTVHRDITLAVRIGATDLAAVYGLRRPKELTIYDLRVVADAIADIVNVFGRVNGRDLVISGAVWEYFEGGAERIFKPQLRESPFGAEERALRARLIAAELDGLIREVVLDRANGLVGKTVIHPSHVPVVHALSVVSSEDHHDAIAVLGQATEGGVVRSAYRNKMNESRPHRTWAERTLRRARAFGVARDDVSFADLLGGVIRG